MGDNNDEIVSTLKQWCDQGNLQEAHLSGNELVLGSSRFGNKPVRVEIGGKVYEYSLFSIFLQILDPNRGLVAYRNECKKHNVNDPVKTLDKSALVGYFFGAKDDSAAASVVSDALPVVAEPQLPVEAEETTTAAVPATAAEPEPADSAAADVEDAVPHVEKPTGEATSDRQRKDDRHKSRSRSEHYQREKDKKRERERSREHRHKSSSRLEDKTPKKKPKEVTNEELFDNLNVVVGKRTTELDAGRIEITKALSAHGFDVTPEMLAACKEAAQTIFENEIPVGNSASILRAANPRKDLSRVLEIFNETVNPPKPPSSSSSKNLKGGKPPPPPGKPSNQRVHLIGKKPVIIVPKGLTAPITMLNAFDFFSNGVFLPRDVAMKQGLNPRTAKTTFTRQVKVHTGSGPVEYEIMDNPKKLGLDIKEWDRVVAVVALGQGWQFKDWVGDYTNPVQLFARTFGFFISMEGDKLPPEVLQWSVKKATLSRDKRGLDSVTFASFWNGLDNWMTVNRRELLPQTQDG